MAGGRWEVDSNEGGRRGSDGDCLLGDKDVGVGSTALGGFFLGDALRCWRGNVAAVQ